MRSRLYAVISLVPLFLALPAAAQDEAAKNASRLADIMSVTQLRHIKLFVAGNAGNWTLADYELRQFKASLVEAAFLYQGIPVSNVTTMADPVQAVATAIKARDTKAFAVSFEQLTKGCNACHQSMGFGYIVMRVPTASPFSNQVFWPPNQRK